MPTPSEVAIAESTFLPRVQAQTATAKQADGNNQQECVCGGAVEVAQRDTEWVPEQQRGDEHTLGPPVAEDQGCQADEAAARGLALLEEAGELHGDERSAEAGQGA